MRLDPQARPFLVLGAIVAVVGSVVVFYPGTSHFQMDGLPITFDYPSSWTLDTDMPATFGFGRYIASVGNVPWDQKVLSPGQIHVELETSAAHGSNICANGRGMAENPRTGEEARFYRVDGFPAIDSRFSYPGNPYDPSQSAFDFRGWAVEAPEYHEGDVTTPSGRVLSIIATYRDPGTPVFRQILDQIGDSIHMFGVLIPIDNCGAPFPAA